MRSSKTSSSTHGVQGQPWLHEQAEAKGKEGGMEDIIRNINDPSVVVCTFSPSYYGGQGSRTDDLIPGV